MSYTSSSSPRTPSPLFDPDPEPNYVPPRRMYIAEPGWRIGVKIGSDRGFYYMRAPGQDFYHRLLDGELFVHRDDERLCLACATRRGLIATEPKRLREAVIRCPPSRDHPAGSRLARGESLRTVAGGPSARPSPAAPIFFRSTNPGGPTRPIP